MEYNKRSLSILIFIAIVFVSTISFGIGYLAALEYERSPIVIEQGDV